MSLLRRMYAGLPDTGRLKKKQEKSDLSILALLNGVKFGQGRLKIGDIHTPSLIKQC